MDEAGTSRVAFFRIVSILTSLFLRIILISRVIKGKVMIEEFRKTWHGCAAEAELPATRGPAARVARWSLDRTENILRFFARTPLNISHAGVGTLTAHERSLEAIATSIAKGDRETARAYAQWLVKPAAIERLLRALEPVSTGPAKLVRVA